MQYINFVTNDDDEEVMHCAPVDDDDAAYLRRIIAELRPLSDEEYMTGPAVVLQTLARFSYTLDGEALYWCIEWQPGLIVVRLTPGGEMAWAASRSPVPGFGGREESEADRNAYDADARNSQRRLVFDPWDAQFDEQDRELRGFVPAVEDVQLRYQRAIAHINDLGEEMQRRFEAEREEWSKRCKKNLEDWCGEGIRLN
jgi:hypothetical protein